MNNIAYSRFGYAMANIGDINGDMMEGIARCTRAVTAKSYLTRLLLSSYVDVAISAPFADASLPMDMRNPGIVYIHHGDASRVINPVPQQV